MGRKILNLLLGMVLKEGRRILVPYSVHLQRRQLSRRTRVVDFWLDLACCYGRRRKKGCHHQENLQLSYDPDLTMGFRCNLGFMAR